MTPNRIRNRTAPVAALPLAGLAVLHGYWALGGQWPGNKDASLGETVVGPGAELPSPPAVWAVAGLLAGSAAGVASAAAERGPTRLARAMSWATGAALLARGAIGLPVSLLTARDTRYVRLDILVYSPLCLALGAAVVRVARAKRRHEFAQERRRAGRALERSAPQDGRASLGGRLARRPSDEVEQRLR